MRRFAVLLLAAASFAQTPQLAPEVAAKMRAAQDAFRAHDCLTALDRLKEVIAAAPTYVPAHNLAANCFLQHKDYALAIKGFQRALELQPDQWNNVSGLIRAYTLAGMTKERDAEREHFIRLQREGKAPASGSFVIDAFDVAGKHVEATEYPQLASMTRFRYAFNVTDGMGNLIERIVLESDDPDQQLWAKDHPELAAAGGRQFFLGSYTQTTTGQPARSLIRLYNEGEPAYQDVANYVKAVLAGQNPVATSTYARAAHPAPLASMPVGGVAGGVVGGVPGGQLGASVKDLAPPPPPSREAVPGLAAEAGSPPLVRVSPGVADGMTDHRVAPEYPDIAKQARLQGAVVLQATIDRSGNVANLRVVSGHPLLTNAAINAVRQWHYRPYVLNGEPVAVETQVTVNFTLQ